MVKVPTSSTFLDLRLKKKKLPKFPSANLHSLPNRSCHLLLGLRLSWWWFTQLCPTLCDPKDNFISLSSAGGRSLPKGPLMRGGDLETRNSLRGLRGSGLKVSPASFVVCLSFNPARRPSSEAQAVNLSETFFPQGKKKKKMFQRRRDLGTATKRGLLLRPGTVPSRLTSGILPLISATRHTGERRDIEVLVVAARLRLPEREKEGLSLWDAREHQQEEQSHTRSRQGGPSGHRHHRPAAARRHGTWYGVPSASAATLQSWLDRGATVFRKCRLASPGC